MGSKNNREWFLHDTENECVRFYDFCIPYLKLIVEFHGEKYHPNPQKLSHDEWAKWRTPYTRQSADQVRRIDLIKEKLAIENGYEYHVVWSSCKVQEAIDTLYTVIVSKL